MGRVWSFRKRDYKENDGQVSRTCTHYMGIAARHIDETCLWAGREWRILSASVFGYKHPDGTNRYLCMSWPKAIKKALKQGQRGLLRAWEVQMGRKEAPPLSGGGTESAGTSTNVE